MPVTQFNMKWVEPAGLVKFDFLGLKTLTVLDVAVKLLKQRGVEIDLPTLPLDDAPSYQMLARGDVVGVFQVESQGMRRALVDMRPTVSRTSSRWWRCIARVRWRTSRPIARASTAMRSPNTCIPMLEPILKETFGVIIYQEQVMQIAQVMAGYCSARPTCCAARWARRSALRWRSSASASSPARSSAASPGAGRYHLRTARRNSPTTASTRATRRPTRWSSYHTAYMKAHYPVEFLAASMTLDMNNTDKLKEFRAEAQRLGIKVEAPVVNRSGADLRSPRRHHLSTRLRR